MEILTSEARRMGVTTLLAEVSSLNEISLNFHKKNGFRECGRLAGVGRKKGQVFDVVWLQKEVAR
jgi:phosphinothricin acetyltransferase